MVAGRLLFRRIADAFQDLWNFLLHFPIVSQFGELRAGQFEPDPERFIAWVFNADCGADQVGENTFFGEPVEEYDGGFLLDQFDAAIESGGQRIRAGVRIWQTGIRGGGLVVPGRCWRFRQRAGGSGRQ